MTFRPGDLNIGDYLLSARSFVEYRAMFSLTDDDLAMTILDCPGGGSSFTATARAMGSGVVAADPAYAAAPAQLAARVIAEVERGRDWALANADRYHWDFYGDVVGHTRLRLESAHLFAADFDAHPTNYHVGSLPRLLFSDRSFDLVVSSRFLFTYSDRLDSAFHRAALLEMARVAREVRVHPLVDQAGRAEDALVDALLGELADAGVEGHRQTIDYEFQRGANTMLVLRTN